MNKQKWLNFAEILDATRVMPRVMLLLFLGLYVALAMGSWGWFLALDPTLYSDISFGLMIAYPTTLLTAIGGMITKVFLEYMKTGRKWQDKDEIERCSECHRAYDDKE